MQLLSHESSRRGIVSNKLPVTRWIVADVEYRMLRKAATTAIIRSPEDAVAQTRERLQDLLNEEFWVLCLSSSNGLTGLVRISTGTLNASLAHPRECFRTAILLSAASVLFIHNHPSGNPEPSAEDVSLTRQLVEAGRIIGIPVHDHIIIAGDQHTSLAERGLV